MDKVPNPSTPVDRTVPRMSEAQRQAYYRGYADGYRDACRPAADRAEAYDAGLVAGVQGLLDGVRYTSEAIEDISDMGDDPTDD